MTKELEPRGADSMSYGKVHVHFRAENIAQVQTDALITPINSLRKWFGKIDQAIVETSGHGFHQAASEYLKANHKATDGSTIFVNGSTIEGNRNFKNVIFVIDDLNIPLRKLVKAGLVEAYKRNLQIVTIPLMRSGVMAGVMEKNPEQVAFEMMLGIKNAADENPESSLTAKIIVHSDIYGSKRKILQTSAKRVLGAA